MPLSSGLLLVLRAAKRKPSSLFCVWARTSTTFLRHYVIRFTIATAFISQKAQWSPPESLDEIASSVLYLLKSHSDVPFPVQTLTVLPVGEQNDNDVERRVPALYLVVFCRMVYWNTRRKWWVYMTNQNPPKSPVGVKFKFSEEHSLRLSHMEAPLGFPNV